MMPAMVLEQLVRRPSVDELVTVLHREHYRDLVRLAGLLLHDRGASEEVVQDAFVRLHTGWFRLRDPERAAAWLRKAVLNGARSRLRHAGVERRHEPRAPGASPSAEEAAMTEAVHARVLAVLEQLPARQREAVVLRYYLDLSEAQMAAAMGITSGSVKTHLHRGLAALHDLLEEER
jgi:RNA polymerase sigma-70 factor (sigma-E family)